MCAQGSMETIQFIYFLYLFILLCQLGSWKVMFFFIHPEVMYYLYVLLIFDYKQIFSSAHILKSHGWDVWLRHQKKAGRTSKKDFIKGCTHDKCLLPCVMAQLQTQSVNEPYTSSSSLWGMRSSRRTANILLYRHRADAKTTH